MCSSMKLIELRNEEIDAIRIYQELLEKLDNINKSEDNKYIKIKCYKIIQININGIDLLDKNTNYKISEVNFKFSSFINCSRS